VYERGLIHMSVYRWVQRFIPLLIDAARPCRHAPGDRWFVDETYAKIAGRWIYLYRAIDQFGQVIDVLVSEKRDLAATRLFFTRALDHAPSPIEVTTDRAAAYPRVLDELVPAACHVTEQYGNNSIEADHGRLKSRLRPMRGLKQLRCARVITAGHAFIQNIRRGHYELGATGVTRDHGCLQVNAWTRAALEDSQAHDQPQVPPAVLGSGMAQGWARKWWVTNCAGIPPRRQWTCSRPGAGVHVVQPSGAPHGPLPLARSKAKAADATGYPLTHTHVLRQDAAPRTSGDLVSCPSRARSPGDSRGTTNTHGQNLTDSAPAYFPAHRPL
jgi:IS6 family transposase